MRNNDRPYLELPAGLPWDSQASLLLDGISVEELPRRLYEWSHEPDFEPLYAGTRWSDLSDVSPCLVRLTGPGDPTLAQHLRHADEEWGYLLFSKADRENQLTHLRWLSCVRHPLGEEMLLRLADPAVAGALLEHAMQIGDATLFGPFEQIALVDRTKHVWCQYSRPATATRISRERPYQLSEDQLELLGEVSLRSCVIQLDAHMQEFFPHYQPQLLGPERWQHLHGLASNAYARGFNSERAITLYANIFGFLGEHALERHADIAALLNTPSAASPEQRIEQAAELARERADSMEGNSI
ncbi:MULTISPECIES: DUF4123 domain-containing protein [unclassified Pseudomonas]|uniref:DUF4123 domain-containing protein n=1 Tax=unclassified Pseudomonas TaxID=196821 RepID=UPI002446E7EE|nr:MULTISPECIES: DUF4123 domain-containing protein [unclassified Pseudomonas]MDG9925815.1 DUF4123 domain-containing protein [Pseudomonas sp. GD04045]MDH0034945.1 DUF4123 domain-containing protein [Pseudomonas sp. GD04019]